MPPRNSARDLRSRVSASRVPPAVPTTVPSLIILGTDAVLAAVPATPVQLAHACLRAGYDTVVPASWGDELIAARVAERLRNSDTPVVQCSCPYVSRRLAAHGDAIAPMMLPVLAPPVATAQYLRAIYAPSRPRITYVGTCPSASHEDIDVWLSPDQLLSSLAERRISTADQPKEFDSVLPPDRRRYFSEPGGLPSRIALGQGSHQVDVIELTGEDVVTQLAEQLLSGAHVLLDVSVAFGCSCSGCVRGTSNDGARARVKELEPPRAFGPIVEHTTALNLDELPAAPQSEPTLSDEADRERISSAAEEEPDAAPVTVEVTTRRRSPPSSRAVLGTMPVSRADSGRQLPRAYVARRRSSPRGMRQSTAKNDQAPPKVVDDRKRWMIVGAAGVVVGLVLAWILSVVL